MIARKTIRRCKRIETVVGMGRAYHVVDCTTSGHGRLRIGMSPSVPDCVFWDPVKVVLDCRTYHTPFVAPQSHIGLARRRRNRHGPGCRPRGRTARRSSVAGRTTVQWRDERRRCRSGRSRRSRRGPGRRRSDATGLSTATPAGWLNRAALPSHPRFRSLRG
jgi:hypothetical protein